jgi:hypothetical protein
MSNNLIENSDVHLGHRYDNRRIRQIVKEKTPDLERSSDIKTPVKSFWILIGALISAIASIVTIMDFVGKRRAPSGNPFKMFESIPIIAALVGVTGLLLILWFMLARERFLLLPLYSLETDAQGSIHLVKPKGKCPICGSALLFLYKQFLSTKDREAVCKRNPGHRFRFDPTTLPQLQP